MVQKDAEENMRGAVIAAHVAQGEIVVACAGYRCSFQFVSTAGSPLPYPADKKDSLDRI